MAPKRPRGDTSILDDATPSKNLKTKQKRRFPNQDKMHTDPEVKASFKKIRSDPAYREMRKQMKYFRSDSTSNQFDWEVYLSAAKQYLNNKEFDEDRERIRSALNEDTSKLGEEKTHAMFAPEYTAILEETKKGGPSVRERYFTEPDSFRKLMKAIKLTIDGVTASSDDVTSLNVVEKPGDVTKSTVDQKIHDDAQVGSWLTPNTENVKDPLLKSWIELGITVGAYYSRLHLSDFFGKKMCVEYLLKKGADPLLENSLGYLPIDLAEFTKSYDVVALLEEQSQIDV